MEKRIEVIEVECGELKTNFGNPRKISKKQKEDLERSLETYGDFGLFLVDEKMNVIAGNQRLSILQKKNPKTKILCKKLIGYSEAELRSINIKDNTHNGEWDLDLLSDWTADLNLDLGVDLDNKPTEERKIEEMELVHYEKYDYVIIACKTEIDYNNLVAKLGIENKKINVCKTRKIKARAIWYDDIKCQIVEKSEV